MTFVEGVEGARLALDSIWSNKFRSFMTILGVLIGVASVIAIVAIIEGVNRSVKGSIEDLGSNVLYVDRYPPGTDYSNLSDEERNRKWITIEEAEAIRKHCPSVAAVAPQNHYWREGGNMVKYKDRTIDRPESSTPLWRCRGVTGLAE